MPKITTGNIGRGGAYAAVCGGIMGDTQYVTFASLPEAENWAIRQFGWYHSKGYLNATISFGD